MPAEHARRRRSAFRSGPAARLPGRVSDPYTAQQREKPGERAERFIEEVRGDDSEVAARLRIEERELEAGGLN